jgi:hypothetical protein
MSGPGFSPGRSAAIGRFALASNLGRWGTRGGLVAGVLVMLVGTGLSLSRGAGWNLDDEFGFMGFFILALFATRSGLEEQRERELTTFVAYNLASRVEHALGLLLSILGAWVVVCAVGFLGLLIAGGGDSSLAAWTVGVWGLRLLLILGLVPVVEAVASVRIPLIVPALFYLALMVALPFLIGEDRAIQLLATAERGDLASYGQLALQSIIVFAALSTLFVAGFTALPTLRRRSAPRSPWRVRPAP